MLTITLCVYPHPVFVALIEVLEQERRNLIKGFACNQIKANPNKFQVLAIGKRTFERPNFRIGNAEIQCEKIEITGC